EALERQREAACNQLLLQGQIALQKKNFQLSLSFYESAAGLRPSEDAFRALALARARAQEAARIQAAAVQVRREEALRRQREQELALVRVRVEEERRRREAEERALRQAQEDRDRVAYVKLLDEGQRLLAQGQYDPAI